MIGTYYWFIGFETLPPQLRQVEVDESWIDAMEEKEAKEKEARNARTKRECSSSGASDIQGCYSPKGTTYILIHVRVYTRIKPLQILTKALANYHNSRMFSVSSSPPSYSIWLGSARLCPRFLNDFMVF